jgi:hypothetical protein
MDASGQSGSHQGLLRTPEPPSATAEKLNAIIVPSARTAPYLRESAGLAEELACPLVVLCSKRAKRAEIVQDLDDHVILVDLVAIDVPDGARPPMPEFATTRLLAGTPFERGYDVSLKRNLGLVLAHAAGWRRVVFLDDDMTVPDPADLRRAVSLLDDHDGVGLDICGHPDNSVVCHAHREAGGWQETFVGGGALAVPTDRIDTFFPDIYNEDWFFLLGESELRRVALIGRAFQQPYDPFADPDRARREEFGDTLAEGIFALLDKGESLQAADEAYWRGFLRARVALIDDVIQRTAKLDMDPAQRDRMLGSLKAARGRQLHYITAAWCVRYMEAWLADRTLWRQFLTEVPRGLTVEEAVRYLGLGRSYTARWNRTGPRPQEPRLREARRRLDRAAARDRGQPVQLNQAAERAAT